MREKSRSEAVLAFVSFCIEEYKTCRGMSGAAAAAWFEKFGVTDYLMAHFDVLHTLGAAAIMADIDRFIGERRPRR